MGAVTNAKQAFAVPFSQTVDLDGEEFDFCPIIQLRDTIFQERSEPNDVAMQGGQAALLDRVEVAFWDNKTDLEIIAAVEENEQFPVAKKSKRLWRIAFSFGNAHPKDVDRHAKFLDLELSFRVCNRVTTVRTNDQVGPHFALAVWRFHADARNAVIFKKQIDDFMLHVQSKGGELLGVAGEKIQKIPLRHESDKFAARRQTREIGDRDAVAVDYAAKFAKLLMRELEKFVEQSELIH